MALLVYEISEPAHAAEIEEFSTSSATGRGEDVAALVEMLADRGLTVSDLVDELAALDDNQDEDDR